MNNSKRIFSTIIFLGLFCVAAFANANTSITIWSKIENLRASYSIDNPIESNETLTSNFYIKDKGIIQKKLTISEPTLILLSVSGVGERQLYIEPGDELEITIPNKEAAWLWDGTGSRNNEFLLDFQKAFEQYHDGEILMEMKRKSAMQYHFYLDKIRDQKKKYLAEFLLENQEKLSIDFKKFMTGKIDYEWAYQLMRYRNEYPAINNLKGEVDIPAQYYNFLCELKLSNEYALLNVEYLYFLDLFVPFASQSKRNFNDCNTDKTMVKIKNSTILYNKLITGLPFVFSVDKDKVYWTTQLLDEEIDEHKWYAISYAKGLNTWVRGKDIDYYVIEQDQEKQILKIVPRVYSEVKYYTKTTYNSVRIVDHPVTGNQIGSTIKGEELEFAYNQTQSAMPYYYKGNLSYNVYYKIYMKNGQEGWVFGGGVDMLEKTIRNEEQVAIPIDIGYHPIQKYLKGKPLHYAKAWDIAQRCNGLLSPTLRQDFTKFINNNQFEDLNAMVKSSFDGAQRRSTVLKKRKERERFAQRLQQKRAERLTTPPKDVVEIPNTSSELIKTLTIIDGTLKNTTNGENYLELVHDPFNVQVQKILLNPGPTGKFNIEIELAKTTTGFFIVNNKRVPIYLKPGVDLSANIDGYNFPVNVAYKGAGAKENNFLKNYFLTFDYNSSQLESKTRYASYPEFQSFMSAQVVQRSAYFKTKKNNLDKDFSTFIETEIDYWFAFNMLNYPYEHPLFSNESTPMNLPDSYYDFLNNLDFKQNPQFQSPNYIYFLNQYLDYRLFQTNKADNSALKIVKQEFAPEASFYIKTKDLVSACRRGEALQNGIEIKRFIEECPIAQYDDALRLAYNQHKGLIQNSIAPDFELRDINGEKVSLSDYAGKVVYIDFWATWCAPCIRYMENSKKLKREYEGEDVIFLYISIDEDLSKWEEFVTTRGVQGVHLAAANGDAFNSGIADLYKVKRLPTYFLIDKDGKLAYPNAASPGGTKIREQLESLL